MMKHTAAPETHLGARTGAERGRSYAAAPSVLSLFERLRRTDRQPASLIAIAATLDAVDDDAESPIKWSEEEVVLLHWRLLKEVGQLADPEAPLEEKFETLRWIFTDREKDNKPFSFVSCLRVVGCSPLSPMPYCGLVDAEVMRDYIRAASRTWLQETLLRYPEWVRDAVASHPEWVDARLARNPQWINEEVKRIAKEGDLFT